MTLSPQSTSERKYQLTVSTYDRAVSLILALLVLVGSIVCGMAVVFFTRKFVRTIEPIPVVPVEATKLNSIQGLSNEPEPPGAEEAPDLSEPQLQDTLETLTNVISNRDALVTDERLDAQKTAGVSSSLGDFRQAGTNSEKVVERVPRWQRWKLRFEPDSAEEFARWLDSLKIEIGVLGRDNLVHYASALNQSTPHTRTGSPGKETRGYTSAADGPMPSLTANLARKANIARYGPVVVLFYPFEVESQLWTLENQHADGRDVNTIRETVFTVVRLGEGFQFEVIDQKTF